MSRKRAKPLTSVQTKLICQFYESGEFTVKELATIYGVIIRQIYQILHGNGITMHYRKKSLPNLKKEQICKEYLDRVSVEKLSKKYNLSAEFIRRLIKNEGIKLHYGGKHKFEPKQITDMICRYEAGEALRAIAKIYSVNHSVIHAVLVENGVSFRKAAKPIMFDKEVELDICREYLKTRDARKVGKQYKVSNVLILQIARAYGIMTSKSTLKRMLDLNKERRIK